MEGRTDLFVSALVLVHQRISVADLLNFDESVDCTALASDEKYVLPIVASCADNNVHEDCVDDALNHENETEGIGSTDNQLAAIARVKRIIDSRSCKKGLLLGLR